MHKDLKICCSLMQEKAGCMPPGRTQSDFHDSEKDMVQVLFLVADVTSVITVLHIGSPQGLHITADIKDIGSLTRLTGRMECESPNRHLYDFVGNIRLEAFRWADGLDSWFKASKMFWYFVWFMELWDKKGRPLLRNLSWCGLEWKTLAVYVSGFDVTDLAWSTCILSILD